MVRTGIHNMSQTIPSRRDRTSVEVDETGGCEKVCQPQRQELEGDKAKHGRALLLEQCHELVDSGMLVWQRGGRRT